MSSEPQPSQLPTLLELEALLELPLSAAASRSISRAVLEPAASLLSRKGKGLRGRLIEGGYLLASPSGDRIHPEHEGALAAVASALELIHAGSLVIDDFQDGSPLRRGRMSLHLRIGPPLAINTGIWMVFWGLRRLGGPEIPVPGRAPLHTLFNEMVVRTLFGQGVDLSTPVDSLPASEVPAVCMTSLRLKSGALVALALESGALLAGSKEGDRAVLREFGYCLGTALQMFDDLGNLTAAGGKQYEDLLQRRPSWLFAHAALALDRPDYERWLSAVRALPQTGPLEEVLARLCLAERAREAADAYLDAALLRLEQLLPPDRKDGRGHRRVAEIAQALRTAY